MPYNNLCYGNGLLSFSFPVDMNEREKNKIDEEMPLVDEFIRKLGMALDTDVGKKFRLIYEIKVPRGYSQASLVVSLVVKGSVMTGFIVREDLTFWQEQFWVLKRCYLDIEDAENNFEKIRDSFQKIISLTKSFHDSLDKIGKEES